MSYEVTGKLLLKEQTHRINDRFQKRECVLEVPNERNPQWGANYIKFQLTQDHCDLIDPVEVGDQIKVHFDLRGNRWEKNGQTGYFTNLEGWRIEKVAAENTVPAPPLDDIPPFPEEEPF